MVAVIFFSSFSFSFSIFVDGMVKMTATSTPQLPFKRPQLLSNRDHKALNRATLGGPGRDGSDCFILVRTAGSWPLRQDGSQSPSSS